MIKNQHIPSEKPRFHSVGRKCRSIEDPHVQDLKIFCIRRKRIYNEVKYDKRGKFLNQPQKNRYWPGNSIYYSRC